MDGSVFINRFPACLVRPQAHSRLQSLAIGEVLSAHWLLTLGLQLHKLQSTFREAYDERTDGKNSTSNLWAVGGRLWVRRTSNLGELCEPGAGAQGRARGWRERPEPRVLLDRWPIIRQLGF